jgi:hypothetical protein
MKKKFRFNCGTQLGIGVPSIEELHILIGSLDLRKHIEVTDNICGQEALPFVDFPVM